MMMFVPFILSIKRYLSKLILCVGYGGQNSQFHVKKKTFQSLAEVNMRLQQSKLDKSLEYILICTKFGLFLPNLTDKVNMRLQQS